ncbi:hypothetical protein LZ31DRAFT_555739 [Colletotrichum somersetense]|nr:hypothetical protein LZ31DRAFT_555739 [Colletotrichum somersetense]
MGRGSILARKHAVAVVVGLLLTLPRRRRRREAVRLSTRVDDWEAGRGRATLQVSSLSTLKVGPFPCSSRSSRRLISNWGHAARSR